MDPLRVDIAICTFRRAHLTETLNSLQHLTLPGNVEVRVIVADNDEMPSARAQVDAVAATLGFPLHYTHAPSCNVSVARNACLDASDAPLIAFIDDDETVSPTWLYGLLAAMNETGAEVVLGPVKAVYGEDAPRWMREANYHSTYPVWVKNAIVTGYAGNALIQQRTPPLRGLRFRHDLGRNGGEDTAFFASAWEAGAVIAYAPHAIAFEAIPSERAKLGWLLRRRFNYGRIYAMLQWEKDSRRMRLIARAAAKTVFCCFAAILSALRPPRMVFWLLRGAMHVGAVAYLCQPLTKPEYSGAAS